LEHCAHGEPLSEGMRAIRMVDRAAMAKGQSFSFGRPL
jgi:hypothetical protein